MLCIILRLRTNNDINSVIVAGGAESAVTVVRSDRSLSALEVQPLIEACPRRSVVGWSPLAVLSDSFHVAVHFVLVLLICCCPSVGRCRRRGRRAAAAVRGVSASVLHGRVIAR